MKWENRGKSRNVIDQRGSSGGGGFRGGAGIPLSFGSLLVIVVIGLIFGINPLQLINIIGGSGTTTTQTSAPPDTQSPEDQQQVAFVSAILDDNAATWQTIFRENDVAFEPAQLVLVRDGANSGCGFVPGSAGPFYCPLDQKIYLDFAFYEVMNQRFGAQGDAVQAYIIAHEYGHHVQNLLGTADDVRQRQQQNPAQANRLSVALELQADCYAGIWGSDTSNARVQEMNQQDFQEAIGAASAIGDDNIQRQTTGQVNPEGFTHGTSAQRSEWFRRGFESGNPSQCDTFAQG